MVLSAHLILIVISDAEDSDQEIKDVLNVGRESDRAEARSRLFRGVRKSKPALLAA
jgi:hypothetical protein